MEIVRKIVASNDLRDIVDIPNSMINKNVEILIFPIDTKKERKKKKKSLGGLLSKYANEKLIEKEENVWFTEAEE